MGNKLLVSLDLLFAIRNQIKLGEDPRMSVSVVLKSVQEQTGKVISGSVLSTELNFSVDFNWNESLVFWKGDISDFLIIYSSIRIL